MISLSLYILFTFTDLCRVTFAKITHDQIDGVSMELLLAPILANIIMTELEKSVAQKLTTSEMIKFYCRYVDDTLLLVKPADILHIHNLFIKIDKIYVS